jgi:hypothetical protein
LHIGVGDDDGRVGRTGLGVLRLNWRDAQRKREYNTAVDDFLHLFSPFAGLGLRGYALA